MKKKIVFRLYIILVFCNNLFAVNTNVVGNSDDLYMIPYYTGVIVPSPQNVEYKDEYISLNNTAIILHEIKQDDPRLKYLLDRIIRYGGKYEIVEIPRAEHSCIIKINDPEIKIPEHVQGYAIKSSGKTISIRGSDFQGLLWAVSSLNQMIFIKNGNTRLRLLNVTDWPKYKIRGMLGDARSVGLKWYAHFMVAFKFNVVDFCGYIPGGAEYLLDKENSKTNKFNKKKFYQSLDIAKKILTPLKIRWYVGTWPESQTAFIKKNAKLQVNFSNDSHFNFFYKTIYKKVAEAGGNASIQLDDFRFPVHPDDIKKFGSSAKADYSFVLKMYNKLKKIKPDIRILFCPPFYFGPKSESNYPEDREEYLKTVGKLPKAIDFYWTGPSVKGRKTEPSDVKWITNLIKRKPFIFQNTLGIPHIYHYHYATDPVYNLKKWYYDGYQTDIKGYFLNGGNYATSGVLVSIAEWTWNEKAYNPEIIIVEAVKKLLGSKAYHKMVEVNKRLSFFDKYYSAPVNPYAIEHAEEIELAYVKLKQALAELKKSIRYSPYNYWVGLYKDAVMNFAGTELPKALEDPAANKFVKYAEVSRDIAEKEAGFNPKTDIFRSAMEFSGGMGPEFYRYIQRKKGIDIKKRFCTWVYGAESIKPYISTKFEISPFPPSGDYKLIVSGVDDDSPEKCPIKIVLNKNNIFEGPNPFSNKDWNIHEFKIPADKLLRNNILTIYNTATSESTTGAPFFMLNYAIIRDTKK